jgi:hypothetical protein
MATMIAWTADSASLRARRDGELLPRPSERVKVLSRRQTISPSTATHHLVLVVTWLLLLQPVTLGAKVVDLVEHAVEQGLGRGARYPGALKLSDLAALPLDLVTHALDFATYELNVRHPSILFPEWLWCRPEHTDREQRQASGCIFEHLGCVDCCDPKGPA